MIALEQARQHLETLGLKQAVEALDNSLDLAANKQLTYADMLAELLGAVEFICHRVSTSLRRLTVIAIGPLTNVAVALDNRPDMVNALSEVVVMGGAVGVPGNITPHAEFCQDPWAANAVLASGVPVTLVGLDVTRWTFMHRRDGPQWFDGTSKSARLGNRILADRFRELDDWQEFHPVAVAAATDPDVLTYRQARVSVVTDGEERGRTVASYGDGTVRVAIGIDVWRAVEIVRSVI